VKGYYRSNGTYVAPYVRSNPNGLKYDNYGYTPSQGLYNKTYGTRGGTWDTPTTITDPNYYEGKALYEAGKFNKSLSYRSNGNSVTELQAFLQNQGFYLGKTDGKFGPGTRSALVMFQISNGLEGDGNFGLNSRAKANSILALIPGCTSKIGHSTTNGLPCDGSKLCADGLHLDDTINPSGCYSAESLNESCNAGFANTSWSGQYNGYGRYVCDCKIGYAWNITQTACN
jgi:hypothetical protein